MVSELGERGRDASASLGIDTPSCITATWDVLHKWSSHDLVDTPMTICFDRNQRSGASVFTTDARTTTDDRESQRTSHGGHRDILRTPAPHGVGHDCAMAGDAKSQRRDEISV